MQSMQDRAKALLSQMTLEEKISILSETAPAIQRLGVSAYHHGNEALHGVVRPGTFTVFPQAIGMAASWNPPLIGKIAEAISDEARAKHNYFGGRMEGEELEGRYNGLLTFWSPNLNVARDPRWGRTGETYGEDPFLAGACGTAFVQGMQGQDETLLKTISTPKHYVANNEEHNRFSCNAVIPRDDLFEYFLSPFEAVVREGKCAAVMAAYNAVNGEPCHASRELLYDILRGRWGFEGYVVSDCGAVSNLWDRHCTAQSPVEAAAQALRAGVDLECGSCGTVQQVYQTHLAEALEQGLISEQEIDRAAENVLIARFRLGLFDQETPWDGLDVSIVSGKTHRTIAREMAEESMVLLKNEAVGNAPLLPLNPSAQKKICVIGNNADVCQLGDYSGKPADPPITPVQAIREIFGRDFVEHVSYREEAAQELCAVPEETLWHELEGKKLRGLLAQYRVRDGRETNRRIDARLDFDWENIAPDPMIGQGCFSAKWQGFLIPASEGVYQLHLEYQRGDMQAPAQATLSVNGRPYAGEWLSLNATEGCKIAVSYHTCARKPRIRLLWRARQTASPSFDAEVEAAKRSDVVIALLGLGTTDEAEGKDRLDLRLPARQLDLLRQVRAVNENIVAVLYSGSSLAIPWLKAHIPAILEAWYPGEEGGNALANLLSGHVSPSGRLPLTFYSGTEDLPPFDCYDLRAGKGFTHWYHYGPVDFPFGAGIGYSSFQKSISDVRVSHGTISGRIIIRNTGARNAADVIQIYARFAGNTPRVAPQKLVWFIKVFLTAGEQKEILFEIPLSKLASYDALADDMRVKTGQYRLQLSEDARTCISETIVSIERNDLTTKKQ